MSAAVQRALDRLFTPKASKQDLATAARLLNSAIVALMDSPEGTLGERGEKRLGQARESLLVLRGALMLIGGEP